MDAKRLVDAWTQRLLAMADDPPFVFRNTPQDLIDAYRRELCTFRGVSEAKLVAAEGRLGVALPQVFRAFSKRLGRSSGGLFRGSDFATGAQFARFRAIAKRLLAPLTARPTLPVEAAVFLIHQGYSFLYLVADGGFDAPVWQWAEGEPAPRRIAASFAALIDAELTLMESDDAGWRERGGYYKSLFPGGGGQDVFPSLASGERPLDRRPQGGAWSSLPD